MRHKNKSIPVRSLAKEFANGIAVTKVSLETFQPDEEAKHSHRHDSHFFVLQEKGTSYTEIDFEAYLIKKPTIVYQSPNQVHRALKVENIEMYILIISNENLNEDYLKLLQRISPVKPLALNLSDLTIIQQAFSLCANIYERSEDKLYSSQLKDSCNTLVALIISQYLKQSKPAEKFSRFETIERSFKELLEQNFATVKRPAGYAKKLNISVPYLNECVKNVTGLPVSHHIQQRVILEAKRLLYYSGKSVKEIASALGYDDYPYFSRLFTKVAGETALIFRNKNHD
ncbi:MAG: helix-turn-helix domain-containing protein [Sphingobacteriales bacterium]|nr:MAG: helix-turn-helix domain-containing protein [Sphingobacteriales bacterium]